MSEPFWKHYIYVCFPPILFSICLVFPFIQCHSSVISEEFHLARTEHKHCQHYCSTFTCLSLFSFTQTISGCARFPSNCIQYRFDLQLFHMLSDILFRLLLRLLWSLCPDLVSPSSPPHCSSTVNSSPINLLCVWISRKKTNLLDREQRWKKRNVKSNERSTISNIRMLISSLCISFMNRGFFLLFISQNTKQPWVQNQTNVQISPQNA